MDILFSSTKLEKEFNDINLLQRRHGPRRAKLIRRRLDDLRAADSLFLLRQLPAARCHELKGDRAVQLSVDLDHPYRLIFVPYNNPVPKKPDGGLDWTKITKIMIVGVEDTHE